MLSPGLSSLGRTSLGEEVQQVRLSNGQLSVALLSLGVALQDVRLNGVPYSLTVGGPALAPYEGAMEYCGTIVGPVANRIGGASAVIDGTRYEFDRNLNRAHTLHSGARGTHSRVWSLAAHSETFAEFTLDLPDGDLGFPGHRRMTARYALVGATLRLTLTAQTDAPTLMNPANHSYWRLDDAPSFAGHSLRIAAETYLPLSQPDLLPTGEIRSVAGGNLDFRAPRVLRGDSTQPIDNNFCLSAAPEPMRPVAWLRGASGLTMEMATTAPGLQVFDGHILEMPGIASIDGPAHRAYAGLALEAQHWPDAANQASFPSILLRPGEDWQQVTEWRFS